MVALLWLLGRSYCPGLRIHDCHGSSPASLGAFNWPPAFRLVSHNVAQHFKNFGTADKLALDYRFIRFKTTCEVLPATLAQGVGAVILLKSPASV